MSHVLTVGPTEVTSSDRRSPEEVHADAMARGAKCQQCPLYGLRVGPVKSQIRPGPLAVLADNPDPTAILTGVPMSGGGGQFLDEKLAEVGMPRTSVSVINVIECRRPDTYKDYQKRILADWAEDRKDVNAQRKLVTKRAKTASKEDRAAIKAELTNLTPPPKPLTPEEACWGRVVHDVKAAQKAGANTFLVLGGLALQSYGRIWGIPTGGKVKVRPEDVKITTLKRMLGAVVEAPGKAPTFIPSYQPGFGLMKGNYQYKRPIGFFIQTAARVAQRGGKIDWKEARRKYILPDKDTIVSVLTEMRERALETGAPIVCDIETDGLNNRRSHIHCVGLGQLDEDGEWVVIVVPWRRQDDHSLWWGLKASDLADTRLALIGELRSLLIPAGPGTEPDGEVMARGIGDHSATLLASARGPTRCGWRWDTRAPVVAEAGSDAATVWHQLKLTLDDPEIQLLGHNFNGFDCHKLLLAGLMTDWHRAHNCTMLGARNTTACDLPVPLGFTTAMRMEVGPWKDAANDKYVQAVSDGVLHDYCGTDVIATGKLNIEVKKERSECKTFGQHRTDIACAPIYRNMGDLGFLVDQHEHTRLWASMRSKRNEFFTKLAHDVWRITKGSTELSDLRQIDDWFPGHGGWDIPHETAIKFNPDSGDLVREILYKRKHIAPVVGRAEVNGRKVERDFEEGDDPSTSASALTQIKVKYEERLKIDHEVRDFVNHLLEYRAYAKIVSTYIEGPIKPRGNKGVRTCRWCNYEGIAWLGNCAICGAFVDDTTIWEEDGGWWLHPQFRQSIPTGRVACSPTIQNWPERGKCNMRRIIVAPPGHYMVGADYDQVELRLYAVIAGDQVMLDVINSGMDAHSYNYATIKASNPFDKVEVMAIYEYVEGLEKKGKDGKQQRKKLRNIAKRFVYLIVYGGEEDKLFSTMASDRDKSTGKLMFEGLSEDDTAQWYVNWHKAHPWTLAWQKACKWEAKHTGYVTSPLIDYRRRFFLGGANKINAAPNSVIQPSAAAIANRGVLRASEWWRHRGWSRYSGLNAQVHDYIGGYTPANRVEETIKRLEDSMRFQYAGMAFTCTAKASRSWGDQ